MASSTRVVIVAVAFTVVATFYSLSELHRMSAMHTDAETTKFATHTGDNNRILRAGAHTGCRACPITTAALTGTEECKVFAGHLACSRGDRLRPR